MEYPLLNYSSRSCPSDQTLVEACHAVALPAERPQLPPASVVTVHGQVVAVARVAKAALGTSLLVGDGELRGGDVHPLSSRHSVAQMV